ncbi:MAG: hypothetical protein JO223_17070 [Hyphomicrobiales bacterium]|nr:hypothetical protein [Hyphomicrobiales bacterium]
MADPRAEDGDRTPAEADAAAGAAQSRTRAIFGSLVGLISAAGLLGTLISAYFQGRSWDYQNGVARIDKDAAAVVAALGSLNTIIDEKWISAYQMDDAIKTRKEGDDLKAATNRFYAANKEWERLHQQLASTLRLDVDSQFGIDIDTAPALINTDCLSYTLNSQEPNRAGPLSVSALLEISYNCHNIIKGEIDRRLQARADNDSKWPATAAPDQGADPGRTRLSHIWWVNKVLQCLMLERALELRRRSPQVPIIPSQMPLVSLATPPDAKVYEMTDRQRAREDQCVEPYRNNRDLGAAASKPQ